MSDEPGFVMIDFIATDEVLAQWNAETDAVTFNWPKIDEIAAQPHPLQGLARIILAARHLGQNDPPPGFVE